ncbi:MAG: hypothetical protein ACREGL_03725, partial [Alphaproteobacteria bacterium]
AGARGHLFDRPQNVRLVRRAVYVLAALALLADAFLEREVLTFAESLFGFYAFYGFIAYSAIVLLAKAMRRAVLRKEDYYDG